MLEPGEADAERPTPISALVRYRAMIIAVTIAATLFGYLLSMRRTPVYEATTSIVLSDDSAFGDSDGDPSRRAQQEANRLASRSVFTAAAETLGGGVSLRGLQDRVETSVNADVGVLEITATGDAPQAAADAANAVANAYEAESVREVSEDAERITSVLTEQSEALASEIQELNRPGSGQNDPLVEGRIQALESQQLSLQTRISEVTAQAAIYGSGIDDIERAVPPAAPTSPRPVREAAVAGIVGLGLAYAIAYWRETTDPDAQLDPGSILGAPLLARIPTFERPAGQPDATPLDTRAAEIYQFLLSSFEFALAHTSARAVLITSAHQGDGKSLTSLHLARALALQGQEVVLLDADIRTRGLSEMLRASEAPGLADLAGGQDVHNVVRDFRVSPASVLPFVPAGQLHGSAAGLLATEQYRSAISRVVQNHKLTLIDSAPLLEVADPSAVANQVDAMIVVLDARTSVKDLRRVRDRLDLTSTPLIGYVLNRVSDADAPRGAYGKEQPRPWHERLFGRR